MMVISTYASKLRQALLRWDWRLGVGFLAGFFLSAAALLGRSMPLSLGLLLAAPPGWQALAVALGGAVGYSFFWKDALGLAWMGAGLAAVAMVGDQPITRRQRLLMPAIGSLIVAAWGVVFLLWMGDDTPIPVHLVRVGLALGSPDLYRQWRKDRTGMAGWLSWGTATLALAQAAVNPYLSLGYIAAGFCAVRCPFPAVALAGLGLDLSGISRLPMTGILCLSFCLRMVPQISRAAPVLAWAAIATVSGWDLTPLPGLLLGCLAGDLLPGAALSAKVLRRKGITGVAQVRLEKAAVTLRKMEQSLLLTVEPELDRRAVLRQAADLACDTCPERKGCKARHQLPGLPLELLEQPGLQSGDLPAGCRKTSRLMAQLRQAQTQLRRMKGDRNSRASHRAALQDQLGYLSDFLQSLSDTLAQEPKALPPRFRPDIGISAVSPGSESGDRCCWFEGVGNRGYFLLCDGMGTGAGAAAESSEAAQLLRQLIEAGYPAQNALRSFNSLCALRRAGGCATVDLLEVDLVTGRGCIYKWGSSVSYLLRQGQLIKIGTAGPPPGLSQQARESVDRLSLGGGEVLIMLSDGAKCLWHPKWTASQLSPGEMAAGILESAGPAEDDATVAVIRLRPS